MSAWGTPLPLAVARPAERTRCPVITYVARNLEPYRGFHQFMRALPAIQKQHKTAHTVIVGGDGVSYGRMPEGAKHWREKMLREVGSKLDPTRTHFLGKVPYEGYKRILQVSAAHVYLTYPFVLSWSMLEAMATGCLVIGSDTAPVREVVDDGRNGRLVNIFDSSEIARRSLETLRLPDRLAQQLRNGARERALGFSTGAGIQAIEAISHVGGNGLRVQAGLRSANNFEPRSPDEHLSQMPEDSKKVLQERRECA